MRSPILRDSLTDHSALTGGGRVENWPTLLVVDDDPHMLATLVCYFERRGFHVAPAATLTEAKMLFHRRKGWTLVISDYHLPDGTGLDLESWIGEQPGKAPPFLLISGSVNGELFSLGVDFLPKPFAIENLDARVRQLLEKRT